MNRKTTLWLFGLKFYYSSLKDDKISTTEFAVVFGAKRVVSDYSNSEKPKRNLLSISASLLNNIIELVKHHQCKQSQVILVEGL